MSITVITTFNSKGYEQYGKRMIEGFAQYWPKEIPLKVYYEDLPEDRTQQENIVWVDYKQTVPALFEYKERQKNNPHANGIKVGKPLTTQKSYLWDAVKFAHKSYCVSHEALNSSTDLVVWLDADVVTHSSVPYEFIESLHIPGQYVSYLGRQRIYPECGFVLYNTKHPINSQFMNDWINLYAKDELFNLEEYHDSYLFWQLLKRHNLESQSHNISKGHPHIPGGHVFINSPLGKYMDHLKGERKVKGRSKKSDLYNTRKETYWKSL